jgi:choline dehydrogenase-like flavoprotein
MEHPHLWSGLYIPSDREIFRKARLYTLHKKSNVSLLGQLTIAEEVRRRKRMLNYSLAIKPSSLERATRGQRAVSQGVDAAKALVAALWNRDLDEFNRHLSTLVPTVSNFSIAAYRRVMRVLNRISQRRKFEVFRLNHMVEQVPNPDSRISLSAQRDHFGQNRVRLDWQLRPIDIRNIIRAQIIIDQELRRSGLGRLRIDLEGETPPPDLHGGWHHMGTTRMHVDPTKGVVDENCKVHGISNLYIAGPSVFPTGGCANPVLTIVALTVKLADHIKRVMV